jgi:isocitrate dehydrogenase kinase/phosphatase
MPQTEHYEDEIAAQPWFSVAENDIFPEEFERFLWFPEPLRTVMHEAHSELFTVDFWQRMQRRNQRGEILDIYPYPQEDRLPHGDLAPCPPVASNALAQNLSQ